MYMYYMGEFTPLWILTEKQNNNDKNKNNLLPCYVLKHTYKWIDAYMLVLSHYVYYHYYLTLIISALHIFFIKYHVTFITIRWIRYNSSTGEIVQRH